MRRLLCAGPLLGALLLGGRPVWAEYQAKGKRDPFVPLLTMNGERIRPPGFDEEMGSDETQEIVLQGIVYDPDAESYAILNGRIIREYEEVEGVRILGINPTTVTILVDGRTQELTVYKPEEEQQKGQ